jgi:hypothetical protein
MDIGLEVNCHHLSAQLRGMQIHRGRMFSAMALKRFSALAIALAPIALAACSTAAPPVATPRPNHVVPVTETVAIETALADAVRQWPEVTPITDPHDPYAALMAMNERRDLRALRALGPGDMSALGSDLLNGERYVWVVQLEGESRPAGISEGSDTTYSFAMFIIDATDGQMIGSERMFEPYFW